MNATASDLPDLAPASRPRSGLRPRLVRYGLRATAIGVVLTGLVGVLHMPFAAPLLRKISPGSFCPIMKGTPAQIDRGHAIAAAEIRKSAQTPAPARPALGFQLDVSRRSDLDLWAKNHGVTCTSIGGNDNLRRCTDVPAAAVGQPDDLGPLEEATFELQSTGELVNVQTLRRHLTAEQAAHAVRELERSVSAAVGAPTSLAGAPTAEHLAHGLLSSYVATHTFTDYRATISSTNLAQTGMMVREEYLSTR